MKRLALFAGIAVLLLVSLAMAAERQQLCGDRQRVQDIMIDAREALAELRGMSAAQPDYITRREMTKKANRLKRLLDRLRTELALPAEDEPVAEPQELAPQPMEAARFEALIKALSAEGFAKGKLRVVSEAAAHNQFSVAQVKKVMRQFSFAEGKVKSAAALHPKVIDPQNFFQVYAELTFDGDKKKLRKLLGK